MFRACIRVKTVKRRFWDRAQMRLDLFRFWFISWEDYRRRARAGGAPVLCTPSCSALKFSVSSPLFYDTSRYNNLRFHGHSTALDTVKTAQVTDHKNRRTWPYTCGNKKGLAHPIAAIGRESTGNLAAATRANRLRG